MSGEAGIEKTSLVEQLLALRGSNGSSLILLYGPPDTHLSGGTVQVNFFEPQGNLFECTDVERLWRTVSASTCGRAATATPGRGRSR